MCSVIRRVMFRHSGRSWRNAHPWRLRPRTLLVTCLVGGLVALAGCTDQTELRRRAQAPPEQRLVGIWNVRLHLDQPLVPKGTPLPSDIHGEIALLANPWLRNAYREMMAPTHYGAYDIDFTTFGFDPRDPGQIPVAVATLHGRDTVELVLAPGQSQTVMLDGTFAGDSVVGTWQASVVRFGAAGRFVMTWRRAP